MHEKLIIYGVDTIYSDFIINILYGCMQLQAML